MPSFGIISAISRLQIHPLSAVLDFHLPELRLIFVDVSFSRTLQNPTRHNLAHPVPTFNIVSVMEVAIRTTFYCWNNLLHLRLSHWHSMYPLQNAFNKHFNELCVNPKKIITVCN